MDKRHIYYGWVIVAISVVNLAVVLGAWYSFSVFFVALIKEFHWSRAATAGVFSVFLIVHCVSGILIGALLDRFGPRRVLPLGSVVLALGLLACSQVSELWQLYLTYGVTAAVGVCASGYVAHSIFLPAWFVKKRGLALGVAMAGIGLGMQVFVPLVQYIISAWGWRTAYVALALIVAGVIIPLNAAFQRRNPDEMGLAPDGGRAEEPADEPAGQPRTAPGPAALGGGLRDTLRARHFWFLALTFCVTSMAVQGTFLHQVAHLVDQGFSAQTGAFFFGLAGITGSGGKIVFGYLSDRIGRQWAFTLGLGCAWLGVLSLMLARPGRDALLYGFSILFGLGYGSIAPIFPARAADLFQGARFGQTFGLLTLAQGMGGALGTWLSGFIFDLTASYRLAFFVLLTGLVAGATAMWFTSPAPLPARPAPRTARG